MVSKGLYFYIKTQIKVIVIAKCFQQLYYFYFSSTNVLIHQFFTDNVLHCFHYFVFKYESNRKKSPWNIFTFLDSFPEIDILNQMLFLKQVFFKLKTQIMQSKIFFSFNWPFTCHLFYSQFVILYLSLCFILLSPHISVIMVLLEFTV